MLINVGEKYLGGARRLEGAQPLGPFDNDGRVRLIEDFVESEALKSAGFQTVEVDVVDRDFAFVLVDQCECRAGNFAGIVDAKTFTKALCEVSLSRAEFTIKKD